MTYVRVSLVLSSAIAATALIASCSDWRGSQGNAAGSTFGRPPLGLHEHQPDAGRGGRSIAVDISSADPSIAIVATETGGLFRTTNGGTGWSHIDAVAPYRMSDVAFAPDGQTVLATGRRDGRIPDHGGVWRSTDAGATWSQPVLAGSCAQEGYGIAFLGTTQTVYLGTDCGMVKSNDLGATWSPMPPPVAGHEVWTVLALQNAGAAWLDVCSQDGHFSSSDGGATWTKPLQPNHNPTPRCERGTAHGLARSPLEPDVLFGIAMDDAAMESDDRGVTWASLGGSPFSEREHWVRTSMSFDMNAAHVDLYFSGDRQTCTSTPGAPRCTSSNWNHVPANPNNHDINGVGFTMDGCPRYVVSDYGVIGADCNATGGNWQFVGTSKAGLTALQVFEVTGTVNFGLSGGGVTTSPFTTVYIGTMDNTLWASATGGRGGFVPLADTFEGYGLQTSHTNLAAPPGLDVTLVSCSPCSIQIAKPFFGFGAWKIKSAWTMPAGATARDAPLLISPSNYVQWIGTNLGLTMNESGGTWATNGSLPQTRIGQPRWGGSPDDPIIYQAVQSGPTNRLARITGVFTTNPAVVTIPAGTGLQSLGSDCSQAFECKAVFAVDPFDGNHLIAADRNAGTMVVSTNGGQSWTTDVQLSLLERGSGLVDSFDPLNGPQAHAIGFDPTMHGRILVGTDVAGIIASVDGGKTWAKIEDSERATSITGFFFDDLDDVIDISSYGRGLWWLNMDPVGVGQNGLTYDGDSSGDYHDEAHLSAHLKNSASGRPLQSSKLHLAIGSQSCDVMTDAYGAASCDIVLDQVPGSYTAKMDFAGDAQYLPMSTSAPFTITRQQTALAYTGDTLLAVGRPAHLRGRLTEPDSNPIPGRVVSFQAGALSCSAATDSTGLASCDVTPASASGPVTISAEFAGDVYFEPSSAAAVGLVFAYLDHGAFVVGDLSANGHVVFWDAQWATANHLSGGPAPSTFKGFAESLSATPPSAGTFVSRRANSVDAPGTIPPYMAVAVSSSVHTQPKIVAGSIDRWVVVHVDGGYGPAPGRTGSGTVLTTIP